MKNKKNLIIIISLLIILCLSVIAGILIGSVKIDFNVFYDAMITHDYQNPYYQILISVRIPRVVAGLLCGIALSISGVILQTVMNNSLAGPNTVGINSGAGFSALLMIILFPHMNNFVAIGAFVGALLTAILVYTIALKTGASRITIILSGVAISSFISAGTDLLTILFPDSVIGANAFMIGGLSGISGWKNIIFTSPYIFIGTCAAILLSSHMNILSLGDEIAQSLGLKVKLYRFFLIAAAALLAGSSVSLVGLLGFVGLIVPHISRFLVGNDARILVPVSAIVGAIFVILCDLLARVLFAPYEIPVGIVLSFLGGPFFIWLILKQRRRKLYD